MYIEQINHLRWIYRRLIERHHEDPNSDYMHKLKDVIDQEEEKLSPNHVPVNVTRACQ